MPEHFHLITPIGRTGDMQTVYDSVVDSFEGVDATYTWWWVQYPDEELGEACEQMLHENGSIRYVVGDRVPDFHGIMALFNIALEAVEADDREGWIWHVQDDNIVPPWAMRKWADAIEKSDGKKVFVCCHDRGDHSTRHRTTPLLAKPQNMRIGRVSLEQYLIHTSLHKGIRYANDACGDGIIARDLYQQYPDSFVFLRDFYIPFNALEPGRWEPEHLSWFTAKNRPMYKMFGLQRSGTNLMQWLVGNNFVTRSVEKGLPWKHGEVPEYPMILDDELVHLVICVKNPYAWLSSFHRWIQKPGDRDTFRFLGIPRRPCTFHDFLRRPCGGYDSPAILWSARNKHWLEIADSHRSSTFVAKAEELYTAKGQLKVLRRIQEEWSLVSAAKQYRTQARRMTVSARPSKNQMNSEYYLDKIYLQQYTQEDLDLVNEQLDLSMLTRLGYSKEVEELE